MTNRAITITPGTIFKAILIGILFWLLYFFRDLLLILLTAVVIASAIEPITMGLQKLKIPRVLAVIFIYLSFALVVIAIFYFFLPPLLGEAVSLLADFPQYIETLELQKTIDGTILSGQNISELPQDFSLTEVLIGARSALFGVSGGLIQVLSFIFGGLFSFILIVVLSFYLAVQERGIENFLRLIAPLKHEKYIIGLWERSRKKIGLWMQGQLLLGLIVGVLVYLGLTILQVKYALLLAVLSALFEIIPLFGPILAATPAVIVGFIDSLSLGFMVLGLFVIIQQFENHLIYPLVVRKVVGVSPIMVIIALIVGAKLAGFLGLLLAVPVVAALMEFADDVQKEKYALAEKQKA